MEVEICRINPDARLPEYKTEGSGCFDIETIEDKVIEPGETVMLSTGLVFRTPPGYFLAVAPRSSSGKKGLTMPHSIGVLDSDYRGTEDELRLLMRNSTDKPIKVEKYQRLAQGWFTQAPRARWKEIDLEEIKEASRGGFGSTG